MQLEIKQILNYAQLCSSVASALERATLNRIINFVNSRLKKGAKFTKSKTIFKKLASTGLSKSKREVDFFYKFIKSLGPVGLLEELEHKAAKRLVKSFSKATKKRKPLVSKSVFINNCARLLAKGDGLTVLAMHIMLVSGRRRKDVSRICFDAVRQLDATRFNITLPFDKTSNRKICFVLDFEQAPTDWALFPAVCLARAFNSCRNLGATPFAYLGVSSISRTIGFRPHGLRAIKALALTIAGIDDTGIMTLVGWKQLGSLELYRRLPRAEILSVGDLDSIIEMINE